MHGAGLDEAAVHGDTRCTELLEDGTLRHHVFRPEDFGVRRPYALEEVRGGTPAENAEIALEVLSGRGTPAQRDFTAANLALILLASGRIETLAEAVEAARGALDAGLGLKVLEAHRRFARQKREGHVPVSKETAGTTTGRAA